MKGATFYKKAVWWIARNEDLTDSAEGLIAVLLVSYMFDLEESEVAEDVMREAKKL